MEILTYDIGVPEGLVEHIIGLQKASQGVKYSNIGGWHSVYMEKPEPWYADSIKTIMNTLENKYKVQKYWFNINGKCHHNKWHAHSVNKHSVNKFVAVYYILVPKNSGAIEFRDKSKRVNSIEPKTGQLIFFNGNIQHRVAENMSDEIRISSAFNLELV